MIAFLQPLALLGLAVAALPAVLHLLTRRVPPTVTFPAVRYLAETERQESRRLKLRHLLLLLLRTAFLACVVLAAARPVARVALGGAHAPTALVLVVDNSASSGAVVEGRRVADLLAGRARQILQRVDASDRLWLILADGLPRPVTQAEALALLDGLEPSPRRLDLGQAVRAAAGVVASQALPGREVVVLSDLQRSAFSSGDPVTTRVLAWTPGVTPENRSLDSARPEPPVWWPSGQVVVAVGGVRRAPAALRLSIGGREVARAVAYPGDRAALAARGGRPGWLAARVSLDPDELRADDDWFLAVRVAEPAPASADAGAGRYVADALAVLQEGGRAGSGRTVVVADRPAGARTIIVPPADQAAIGALNRALAARGVQWRFGDLAEGEWTVRGDVGPAEGSTVRRRYRLVPSANGVVLARANDDPWLVRDREVVMLGSRLEDGWTDLPVTAAFVPFLDLLINRIAAGETRNLGAHSGEVVTLPSNVEAVLTPAGAQPVAGNRRITAPQEPGVYFLRGAGRDTVGALEVNHDPRESRLAPADAQVLRAAVGPGATLVSDPALDRELFGGARRADLSGALLLAALLVAVLEFVVSSVGAKTGRGRA
ncbi:MAG TPA: BatA domain-containing protein [Gemmatimonadales bacterium]|nr:BatA domain-containing protein [Gemmatimonadales bacterium]